MAPDSQPHTSYFFPLLTSCSNVRRIHARSPAVQFLAGRFVRQREAWELLVASQLLLLRLSAWFGDAGSRDPGLGEVPRTCAVTIVGVNFTLYWAALIIFEPFEHSFQNASAAYLSFAQLAALCIVCRKPASSLAIPPSLHIAIPYSKSFTVTELSAITSPPFSHPFPRAACPHAAITSQPPA